MFHSLEPLIRILGFVGRHIAELPGSFGFAPRSCCFSSTSSFQCIPWLLAARRELPRKGSPSHNSLLTTPNSVSRDFEMVRPGQHMKTLAATSLGFDATVERSWLHEFTRFSCVSLSNASKYCCAERMSEYMGVDIQEWSQNIKQLFGLGWY